jgi:hypothetical protein
VGPGERLRPGRRRDVAETRTRPPAERARENTTGTIDEHVAEARRTLATNANHAADYLRAVATNIKVKSRKFQDGDQTAGEFISGVRSAVLNMIENLVTGDLPYLARAASEVDGTREEERRG